MDAKNAQRVIKQFVAPVDQYELAARIIESGGRVKRPAGMTAKQAIDSINATDREDVMRTANAVLEYISECVRNARQPS